MNKYEKKLLSQIKHRYYNLVCIEVFLILLQTIGLLLCFGYIISTYLGYKLPDIPVSTGVYHFSIKEKDMNLICMIISILLFFSRPKSLKDKRITVKLAKKYLKSGEKADYNKSVIKDAKNIITDIDRYHQKKKDKEETLPHEKRMVMRKRIIFFGISGISILSIILIFIFGWNVPQTASINLLIGYSLVIFEAQYYQILLKRKGIKMFSNLHRDMIEEGVKKEFVSTELVIKRRKKKKSKKERFYERQRTLQQYKQQKAEQKAFHDEMNKLEFTCYQKICYMTKDRKANYCMVFGVAALAMNFLSLIITLLDSTKSVDFEKLFALPINSVNNKIALFFASFSIVFFIVDIFLQNIFEDSIKELEAKGDMKYSENNYVYLKEMTQEMMTHNLFSLKILDVGRGIYDFNNDQLGRKCIKEEKNVFIPVSCMFTVEEAFSGRVPRYKLTILITWLCAFCTFVWGKANLKSIVPISLGAIVLYDILLILAATKLWSSQKEWRDFERDIESRSKWSLYNLVSQDFIKLFLVHSIIISFLSCICMVIYGSKSYFVLIFFFCFTSLISVLGCLMKSCKKVYPASKKSRIIALTFVCILGILQNIIQYTTVGKTNGLPHTVNSLIIIPLLVYACSKYYEKVSKDEKNIIPINLLILLLNWSCIAWMLHWCCRPQRNFSEVFLGCNVLFDSVTLVVLVVTISRIILAAFNRDKQNVSNLKKMKYPYSIFMLTEIFLITWGFKVFINQYEKVKFVYYIACLVFLFLLWGSTKKLQVVKFHNLILAGMLISMIIYMAVVAVKCYILA